MTHIKNKETFRDKEGKGTDKANKKDTGTEMGHRKTCTERKETDLRPKKKEVKKHPKRSQQEREKIVKATEMI